MTNELSGDLRGWYHQPRGELNRAGWSSKTLAVGLETGQSTVSEVRLDAP